MTLGGNYASFMSTNVLGYKYPITMRYMYNQEYNCAFWYGFGWGSSWQTYINTGAQQHFPDFHLLLCRYDVCAH